MYTMVTVDLIRARGEHLKQQREQLVGQINQIESVKTQALANLNVINGAIQICDELVQAANAIDVKNEEPAAPATSPDGSGDSRDIA